MKPFAPFGALVATTLAVALAGCGSSGSGGNKPTATPRAATPTQAAATPTPQRTATAPPTATPATGGELDIAVCAPDAGPFSADIDNPFFPLPAGAQWILVGVNDEGAPVRVVITALSDTEMVAGVTTRVVEEREWEDGSLVEVSRNFFVQTGDGVVCYYGEDVDDYEAGAIVGHGGAWRAGVDGALPGILMPAAPAVGQTFRQEVAVGIAQDRAELVAAGETTSVGLGTFTDTIRFIESSPLDSGTSEKVYARGIGLLVDAPLARIGTAPTVCGTNDGQGCAPDASRVDLATPSFSNPTVVTNPLFPISQLHSVVLLGIVDGESFRSEVTLLPTGKVITLNGQQVTALESQYVAFLDGRCLEEVALDWYAQDDAGAVWYLGEDVFNYADGELADTGGTWLAGRDGPAAMIMPANPQVGDVYRPENIPGLVFEEVTVHSIGQTVAGPYGPVAGAIEVVELHQAPPNEDKTFAPGYGEFFTGGGGDSEALALAVPTDALSTPLPAALATLTDGADEVFDAAEEDEWAAASTAVEAMRAAWDGYRAGAAPLLEQQLEEALASLEEEVDAEAASEARQAAIDVARATLDFHLRHRPPTEVDRARFGLWANQILVDVEEEDGAAVRGDFVTLEWLLRRFAHTLSAGDADAINGLLDQLGTAIEDDDLAGAAEFADQLRDALE